MKRIFKILFLSGLTVLAASCDDDESEGIRKGFIRFPSIILEGDGLIFIQQDGSYTDAGAKAFLGEEDITDDLVTESSVDTSEPGIYYVTYSSSIINELGQQSQASQLRTIVVYPENPNIADDLSGTYERALNGAVSVWAKVDGVPGVYTVTNVGGVVPPTSPVNITAYAFHFADESVTVPEQIVVNGVLSGEVTWGAAGYTIVINHVNFGTNDRIFTKQEEGE